MASKLFTLKYSEILSKNLKVKDSFSSWAILEATREWISLYDPRNKYILSTLPQGELKKIARTPCILSPEVK